MGNETFQLILKRHGLVGCAMTLRYIIDGEITGILSPRKETVLELPRKRMHIKVFVRVPLTSKEFAKEFLIDPGKNSHTCNVSIKMKINYLGMLPLLDSFYQTTDFIIKTEYLKSESGDVPETLARGTERKLWKTVLRSFCLFFKVFFLIVIFLFVGYTLMYLMDMTDSFESAAEYSMTNGKDGGKGLLFGAIVAPWFFILFSLIFYLIFTILANKLRQKQVDSVDFRDPLILYLRSFKADSKTSEIVDPLFSMGKTEEEETVEVFSEIAPVVAIGAPLDKTLPHGAARFYVDDSIWQDTVLRLLDTATLVVLRLGETSNFWWEVSNALRKCPKEKLVFLVPNLKNSNVIDKLENYFSEQGISVENLKEMKRKKASKGSISYILYFINGELVCKFMKYSWYDKFLVSYKELLRYTLQPLFTIFGFSEKKHKYGKRAFHFFLDISIFVFLIWSFFSLGIHVIDNKIRKIYVICAREDANFAKETAPMNADDRLEFTLCHIDRGMGFLAKEDFFKFYIINLFLAKDLPAEQQNPFNVLAQSNKRIVDDKLREEFLNLAAKAVFMSYNNICELPVVQEDEIQEELKFFNEFLQQSGEAAMQNQFDFTVTVLDKMRENNLDAEKFLIFLYQTNKKNKKQ